MIKINLNPKKEKKKLQIVKSLKLPTIPISLKSENIILIAIPVMLSLSAVGYLLYIKAKTNTLNEKKDMLSAEIQKYRDIKAKIDILKKEIEEDEKISENLDLRMKTYEHLSSGKILAGKVLKLSIDNIPDGVWLENVVIATDKSNISGYAFQPEYITKYYNNLVKFYDISFNATESKTSPTNLTYYTFSLELKPIKETKRERSM